MLWLQAPEQALVQSLELVLHQALALTLHTQAKTPLEVDQQVVEGSTLVAAPLGETVLGMASNPTSTPHRGPAYSGQGLGKAC